MIIKSVNPFNNEINAEFNEYDDQKVENILKRADFAYASWKKTTFAEREKNLIRVADLLRAKKHEFAELITREMGKVKKEALAEIEKSALICNYYAEYGSGFLQKQHLEVPEGKSWLVYDPLGPVLAVMPWNFPFYQVFRFTPSTLMAGNVVLLKHASNVPLCALKIEEIFQSAGFPEGVFQTLLIGSGKVNKVINDSRVAATTITGSVQAGSKVASAAGANIKKSVLELGGSDPFIVLSDANIDKAASTAAKARMINCGQSCIAAKRFIIIEKVADEFLSKFKKNLESMHFGDPSDIETDYASLASLPLKDQLNQQVEKSVNMGAKILWKNSVAPENEAFFNQIILRDIKNGSPAYDEELFGPVASVFIARDPQEAALIANDSQFGLGASIWTEDSLFGEEFARNIESGIVYINDLVASKPEVPFGGVKKSGYGRELSSAGIHEFVNRKTIWLKKT